MCSSLKLLHLCFSEHKSRYERFLVKVKINSQDQIEMQERLLNMVWSFSSKGKPIISEDIWTPREKTELRPGGGSADIMSREMLDNLNLTTFVFVGI